MIRIWVASQWDYYVHWRYIPDWHKHPRLFCLWNISRYTWLTEPIEGYRSYKRHISALMPEYKQEKFYRESLC